MTDYSLRKEVKKYFKNNELKKHYFHKDEKLDSEYKSYYKNTELKQHYVYKNGKKNGECKNFRENGKLETHCFYINDKKDGEYKNFGENGQLITHCFYVNDKKEGEFKRFFYKNGQLKKHCFYVSDKIEGVCKQFFDDGKIFTISFYKERHMIENNTFSKDGLLQRRRRDHFEENMESCLFKTYDTNHKLCDFYFLIRSDKLNIKKIKSKKILFNFKIYHTFLKYRDILKKKMNKPKYELLDNYVIPDISNMIVSYLYLSNGR